MKKICISLEMSNKPEVFLTEVNETLQLLVCGEDE
jgi:hypothetical protein